MGDWDITIQDFQSIKYANLKVCKGLNIIVGKTNEGKSSIFRAIDSALFNTGTDDMVRSGKKVAGVTISNGEHTMTYCRNAVGKNEKTAYQFDGGAVQKKVGRSQLPEVAQMFGVTDVRMQNNVKVKLNFWYQNDKPFLMDKTSGQLYEFLSLSSADRYFKVLKRMGVDIKVQKAEIDNANTVIDTLKSINNDKQDFIDKNQGFDDLYAQIISLGNEADKLNKSLSIIETLKDIQGRITDTTNKLKEATDRYNAIPIDQITEAYNSLVSLNQEYDKLHSKTVFLYDTKKKINEITVTNKTVEDKFNQADSVLQSITGKVSTLDTENTRVSTLIEKANQCKSLKEQIQSIQGMIEGIRILDEDTLNDLQQGIGTLILAGNSLQNRQNLINVLSGISDSISGVNSSISGVSKQLEDKENELESFKSQIGYCPFCGSVFGKEEHNH